MQQISAAQPASVEAQRESLQAPTSVAASEMQQFTCPLCHQLVERPLFTRVSHLLAAACRELARLPSIHLNDGVNALVKPALHDGVQITLCMVSCMHACMPSNTRVPKSQSSIAYLLSKKQRNFRRSRSVPLPRPASFTNL